MTTRMNWNQTVGAALLCVCLAVVAAEYNCPDCTTTFKFGEFAAKEVWATKDGIDIYGGINMTIVGPTSESHAFVKFDQVAMELQGNYFGPYLPDILELDILVNVWKAGSQIDQGNYQLTVDHIQQELDEDNRTTVYPLSEKIGKVFDFINDLNHMNHLMSGMMNLAGGSFLYWQNPYVGVPVVNVSGSQINYGVQFHCTTNTATPCI